MILGFTLKDENVVALSIARGIVLLGAEWNPRLQSYFRSSYHDPWFTLKDENRGDVEQDGILLY